jgi:hypothetical protein
MSGEPSIWIYLSRREKLLSVITLGMTTESPLNFIYFRRKRKISIKLENNGKMVITTILGSGVGLYKGNVLASLTSILYSMKTF